MTSRFGRDVRQRYLELAVFPEDEPIPEAALAVLWGAAGLDDADVRDLMDELLARSLTQRSEKGTGSDQDQWCQSPFRFALRLHDLQVDYLLGAASDVSRLHDQFVDAYAARCPDGFATGADDGYYFRHLAYHLVRAGRSADLRRLLRDADWLQVHLAATDPAALDRRLPLS